MSCGLSADCRTPNQAAPASASTPTSASTRHLTERYPIVNDTVVPSPTPDDVRHELRDLFDGLSGDLAVWAAAGSDRVTQQEVDDAVRGALTTTHQLIARLTDLIERLRT